MRITGTYRRALTLAAGLLTTLSLSSGAAHAAGIHGCALGPASNPQVKAIKTNTSCKTAVYFGYLVSVPRATFPYINRTWKGHKSAANGHVEFIFTTIGRGPLLKVWVLF